jgi:hypothetical protein
MLVIVTCKLNERHPGTVYASVKSPEGELMINATLDYCLSACKERGYQIENAQDVLLWLHKNAEFHGYKTEQ